jgi:hypothetical protein
MAANQDNFRVDPNNYLGHQYESYLSKMYTLALSRPTDYLALRETVREKVKRAAVETIYKEYYSILTQGKLASGASVYGSTQYTPAYPQQKVNDFCLSAAASLNEILDDLCEIIIPDKMNEIMGDKIGKAKVL